MKLKQNYFSRQEVALYFGISITSLVKLIYEHWLKETIMTWKKDDWGKKLIRISQSTIDKLEIKINK